MLAEWSAECSHDDPVLVVPWTDHTDPSNPNPSHFIDLRDNPYDLDHLSEAERYPALMHALRALNAPRSAVFTAKCDAWPLSPEELDALRLNVDPTLGSDLASSGFASYIDLLLRERSHFVSFHQNEQLLHRLARRAATLDQPYALLDCVIRPAFLDLTGPQEGFSISLYVKALGPDSASAHANWSAALEAVVALLRGKDLL